MTERASSALPLSLQEIADRLWHLGEAAQKWPPTEPNLAEQIWDQVDAIRHAAARVAQLEADLARVTAERDKALNHIEALRDMPPTFAASMMLRMEKRCEEMSAELEALRASRPSQADPPPTELSWIADRIGERLKLIVKCRNPKPCPYCVNSEKLIAEDLEVLRSLSLPTTTDKERKK